MAAALLAFLQSTEGRYDRHGQEDDGDEASKEDAEASKEDAEESSAGAVEIVFPRWDRPAEVPTPSLVF